MVRTRRFWGFANTVFTWDSIKDGLSAVEKVFVLPLTLASSHLKEHTSLIQAGLLYTLDPDPSNPVSNASLASSSQDPSFDLSDEVMRFFVPPCLQFLNRGLYVTCLTHRRWCASGLCQRVGLRSLHVDALCAAAARVHAHVAHRSGDESCLSHE